MVVLHQSQISGGNNAGFALRNYSTKAVLASTPGPCETSRKTKQ